MDAQRAAEELKVIRQLMERPIRYSVVSGLSAILAGLDALGGVWADWYVSSRFDARTAFWLDMLVWAGVFVLALVEVLVLTRLREIRQGLPFWSSAKMRVLGAMLPPFLVGAGLTMAIVARWCLNIGPNEWGLIPAIWMCCYGLACWHVGEFSNFELRVMGLAFLSAGVISALLFQNFPYMTLGVTFGGFHLCYGAIVWMRHGG